MSTTPLILVCDDQAMVHEALGVYLQNEGYQMVSAYDGAERSSWWRRKNRILSSWI